MRLMPLFDDHDVTFISTNAIFADTVKNHKFYSVPDSNRKNKVALFNCTISITKLVFLTKPEVIVTTGAAPGLIGIFIGKFLGAKTIWIDSIANVEKLSMSGKMAIKLADRVYTQWEHLATSKVFFSGNVL